MKEILILIIISFAVVSCGNKIVRDNPREQYRQCLKENPENITKCDHLKDAYQQRYEDKVDAYQKGSGSEEGFY
ncbi:MAG: hypothetical protein ACR2NW_05620 [Thermodesulfobacteriota bacterium]